VTNRSDAGLRVREAQKHLNPTDPEADPDSEHRSVLFSLILLLFRGCVGEEQDDEGAVHQDEPRDQRLGGPAARVSLLHLRSDCRVGDQNEGKYYLSVDPDPAFQVNPDPCRPNISPPSTIRSASSSKNLSTGILTKKLFLSSQI
jgi:hypothetical protein